jgi:radical SAM protein with 4Fe4S-binding SPASM domain
MVKVNADQFVLDSRRRELLWHLRRRHKLAYYLNRLQWYLYPNIRYVPPFPIHVDYEVSSICNMNCPMCFRPHRSDQNDGLMDFDLFRQSIDECASHHLYSIRLSWRGEPTMHPRLLEMVAYAKRAGIKEISFLTNGMKIQGDYAEALVRAGVDYLSVSIDGLYENYNRIRKPAKFEDTVARLRNLRRLRDSVGRGFPLLKVNTIWSQVKERAREYYDIFSPLVDIISFNPDYDYVTTDCPVPEDHVCQYPYQRLTIKWNGDVPMCISDWDCEVLLGNIGRDRLKDLWDGPTMQAIRTDHKEGRARDYGPCRKCHRPVTEQIGNQRQ